MTAEREIRWGIVGPGRIAAGVVQDFPHAPGARAVAVASRSLDRAQAFADKYGLDRAYGSYAEIMSDDEVDALYIATPHPQHHAIAVAALNAGKAVLVEKTFTATVAGAIDIIETARRNRVFAMEAMWTRFQPAIVLARELIEDGAIGEVRQAAGRSRRGPPVRPDRSALRPGPGGWGHAGSRGLPGVVRAALPRYARSGARQRITGPDRGGRGGRPAAGLRRRPRRVRADVAARRHPRSGPDPGHRRLDRRAAALPPSAPDRAEAERPGAGDLHPAAERHRLLPRARRGERVHPRRAYRERDHAAGRHPRRAADPQRSVRSPRRDPPRGHHVSV